MKIKGVKVTNSHISAAVASVENELAAVDCLTIQKLKPAVAVSMVTNKVLFALGKQVVCDAINNANYDFGVLSSPVQSDDLAASVLDESAYDWTCSIPKYEYEELAYKVSEFIKTT